ncbi:MAG TPA: glutaredoxin 3 [Candidatus Binatia bacterium]|nr:glutaredoxin 3 [Candidatus Binatia bacterium]
MSRKVRMYTTRYCPFCVMAKRLFQHKGVAVEEIAVDADPSLRQKIVQETGRRTVPVIFIGDEHVGGFDEVAALERQGRLDPLLAGGVPEKKS